MVLSGRFAVLALLGVLTAIAAASAAVVFAGALVLAALVDLTLAGRIADLRLARAPSSPVRLGGAGGSRLRVSNSGRRRLHGLVRDAWVPSAGAQPRSQSLTVPPGERRALATALRPTRRGERRTGQVTIRSYGPLGLAARQRRLEAPGTLQVLPAFASRRFLPEKLSRLRQIDGAVLVRQRGQGSEFDVLRTYVLGDDVRAIDWRATPRARGLVGRAWGPERGRTIGLALHTRPPPAPPLPHPPR